MLALERLLLATHNMPRDMQWTVQRHAQMLASPRLHIALPYLFQVTTAAPLQATLWHATLHAVLHNAIPQFFAALLTVPPFPSLPLPCAVLHNAAHKSFAPPCLSLSAGDHGSTFAGNPLVCHTACTVFDIINSPDFLKSVTAKGEKLKEGEQHEIMTIEVTSSWGTLTQRR